MQRTSTTTQKIKKTYYFRVTDLQNMCNLFHVLCPFHVKVYKTRDVIIVRHTEIAQKI